LKRVVEDAAKLFEARVATLLNETSPLEACADKRDEHRHRGAGHNAHDRYGLSH
jgi:hypothetical protein